jgi:hypothetical protein
MMQAVVVALLSGMESVSCDLCQSENAQVMCRQRDLLQVVTDEEFSVVCCGACGVFYLNNSHPRQEEIGRYYPANTSRYLASHSKDLSVAGESVPRLPLAAMHLIHSKETCHER